MKDINNIKSLKNKLLKKLPFMNSNRVGNFDIVIETKYYQFISIKQSVLSKNGNITEKIT